MAEFPTDEHRDSYVKGLELERLGYTQRRDGATAAEEKADYGGRVAQVDAEIKRLAPTDAVETRPGGRGAKVETRAAE